MGRARRHIESSIGRRHRFPYLVRGAPCFPRGTEEQALLGGRAGGIEPPDRDGHVRLGVDRFGRGVRQLTPVEIQHRRLGDRGEIDRADLDRLALRSVRRSTRKTTDASVTTAVTNTSNTTLPSFVEASHRTNPHGNDRSTWRSASQRARARATLTACARRSAISRISPAATIGGVLSKYWNRSSIVSVISSIRRSPTRTRRPRLVPPRAEPSRRGTASSSRSPTRARGRTRRSRGRRRARRRSRGAATAFAARPSSLAIRISRPTPGRSIVTNGFAGTSLRSSYIPTNLPMSSRLNPNAVCVRSFVPNEKKSALSAISAAVTAAARELDHRPPLEVAELDALALEDLRAPPARARRASVGAPDAWRPAGS